jgi:hypothetical protein
MLLLEDHDSVLADYDEDLSELAIYLEDEKTPFQWRLLPPIVRKAPRL